MRFFLFTIAIVLFFAYAEAAFKNNQAANYVALQPSFNTKTAITSNIYTRGPYSMCYNAKTGSV